MAISEEVLKKKFGKNKVNHKTYVLVKMDALWKELVMKL